MPCASLVLLFGVAAKAQTIFPSDGEDPNQDGAELLEAVCPGRVAIGKEIRCRIVCPKFTDFPDSEFVWSLARVTRGHFLSPTSEDAVLQMEGCEPHSANFGGSILLTRRSQRWIMIWYKPGVFTGRCHKIPLATGREILVCMGTYGGQGNNWTAFYAEDLLAPSNILMSADGKSTFFQVFKNTLTCGWNSDDNSKPYSLIRSAIEKVEFKNDVKPIMSITATFGKRLLSLEDAKTCIDEQVKKPNEPVRFYPATKSYRVDFVFNGHEFKISPYSAAFAQILSETR